MGVGHQEEAGSSYPPYAAAQAQRAASPAAHPMGSQQQWAAPPVVNALPPQPYPVPAYPAGSGAAPQQQQQQFVSYGGVPQYPAPPAQREPSQCAYQPALSPPPIAVPALAVYAPAPPAGADRCACTAGWVLFGTGFLFPICWIVGMFLPCCTQSRNDRRAAIGSAIAFSAVAGVLLLFLVILPLSLGWYAMADTSYMSNSFSSYSDRYL
ncbi:MAG: hypothetical protein J3K34DRAFT_425721 [Monoraphidium minutum]|nr:MAG: hypothetical protein J3K34DRAFT_425721 [Monoraphidium minutum]